MSETPKDDIDDQVNAMHRRAKRLLGEAYNEQKVNGSLALNQDMEGTLNELEAALNRAPDPLARSMIIERWYEEHDILAAE